MNDKEVTGELIIIEKINALTVFTDGGLDPILEKIEKEADARAAILDISTPEGREEIASLAHKIARSKTALDKMGKDLVAAQKEALKKVDVERARAWNRLEAKQKAIRAPLTEWEDRNKDRIANHENALAEINQLAVFLEEPTSAEIEKRIARSVEIPGSRSWEEFTQRAEAAHKQTYDALLKKLEARKKHDVEQAELARLRQEEADRRQKEHEERIAKEAADKAKAAAEEKARRDAEAEAMRVKAEQEKAEQERLRIQQEKEDAEARAKKADEDRLAAIKKAAEDKKAAEEKAERDRKAAEDKARRDTENRIAAEQQAERDATARREADTKHKKKVNNEALAGLVKAGLPDDAAKKAIEAIAKGLVQHIKIQY